MKRFIASVFLGVTGWRARVDLSPEMRKSVMIAAPHTSNWDFPIALLAFWKMRVDVKYFIKDDYVNGAFGWFFKWTGAIGVDRSKGKNHLTQFAIDLLKENEELVVLVTPEGTRKRVEKWRTGFYRIAMAANVPITLAYVHFPDKITGIQKVFFPSGNFEEDMAVIEEVYRPFKGKFPENFNPKIY